MRYLIVRPWYPCPGVTSYPTSLVFFVAERSVQVMVCDDVEILENVHTAAVKTEVTEPSTAENSKGREEARGGHALKSSGEELFDVILLGGGAVTEAAKSVPVSDGGVEGVATETGRTPAERLDLVLDRWG